MEKTNTAKNKYNNVSYMKKNVPENELQEIIDIFGTLIEKFEFIKYSNEENFIVGIREKSKRKNGKRYYKVSFDLFYVTSETTSFTIMNIDKVFLLGKNNSFIFKDFSIKFNITNKDCKMKTLDKEKIIEFVKNNKETNIQYVDFSKNKNI